VDFELDVTIAIAAITDPDGHIVTVSDRALSNQDVVPSADDATLKFRKITRTWAMLFAANDANMFLPLVDISMERLLTISTEGHDLETVEEVVSGAYKVLFDREFSSRHLSRFGLKSIEEFRTTGRDQFGEDKFKAICEEVEAFDLRIELLCCGFDTKKRAHIFEVKNPGTVTNHDLLRYAIIGSGFWMALSSLRRRPFRQFLEETIYRLLEAKFSAETATGVGELTAVITMNNKGVFGVMYTPDIDKVKAIWREERRRPDPESALKIVEKTSAVRELSDEER